MLSGVEKCLLEQIGSISCSDRSSIQVRVLYTLLWSPRHFIKYFLVVVQISNTVLFHLITSELRQTFPGQFWVNENQGQYPTVAKDCIFNAQSQLEVFRPYFYRFLFQTCDHYVFLLSWSSFLELFPRLKII